MNRRPHQITLSAVFLALALILPFFTGQIPQFGQMLLPMHLPVLICGFVCGWRQGLLVGFLAPLLRSGPSACRRCTPPPWQWPSSSRPTGR